MIQRWKGWIDVQQSYLDKDQGKPTLVVDWADMTEKSYLMEVLGSGILRDMVYGRGAREDGAGEGGREGAEAARRPHAQQGVLEGVTIAAWPRQSTSSLARKAVALWPRPQAAGCRSRCSACCCFAARAGHRMAADAAGAVC